MKTIYKYSVHPGRQFLRLLVGSLPMSVGYHQKDGPVIYFMLDLGEKVFVDVEIMLVGTGWGVPTNELELGRFMGTIIGPTFVWHVFVLGAE